MLCFLKNVFAENNANGNNFLLNRICAFINTVYCMKYITTFFSNVLCLRKGNVIKYKTCELLMNPIHYQWIIFHFRWFYLSWWGEVVSYSLNQKKWYLFQQIISPTFIYLFKMMWKRKHIGAYGLGKLFLIKWNNRFIED